MNRSLAPDIKLGLSVAASWMWGTSLIVGMEVARTRGMLTWLIWAGANTLALWLFGELTRRGILGRRVFNKPAVRLAGTVIQCFILVINLNVLHAVLLRLGILSIPAYWLASGMGLGIAAWMYRGGLSLSILTDRWQWLLTVLSASVIISIGCLGGAGRIAFPAAGGSDVLWGLWSSCILLSGPIGDIEHWQRAELAGTSCAFGWGAAAFALYLGLVFGMSLFEFNRAMNLLLLMAGLCATSSTLDSVIVALHEAGGRKAGTGIAVALCLLWGLLLDWGVLAVWSWAGIFRVAFALYILALAYRHSRGRGHSEA